MQLSKTYLQSHPTVYFLLLNDFIKGRKFTLQHGETVVFEHMGDQYKFFSPSSLVDYHDVASAYTWMRSNDIYFTSAGGRFHHVNEIQVPKEYHHGLRSEFYNLFVYVGVLMILTGISTPDNITRHTMTRKGVTLLSHRTLTTPAGAEIDVRCMLDEKILEVVQGNLFLPLLYVEMIHAIRYLQSENVKQNLKLLIARKTRINIQIGQVRGSPITNLSLNEQINGNLRRVYLDHRPSITKENKYLRPVGRYESPAGRKQTNTRR